MKYIGIIGAMQIEIEKLLEIMNNKNEILISNIKFYTGDISNMNIVMCVCNEGKVNSAICTQVMLMSFDISLVINCGVAGSLNENLKIFDFAIANSAVQHDYDISSLGYEKGLILGIDKKYIPCDEYYSNMLYNISKENNNSMLGTIASGDVFVADSKLLNEIKNNFNAIAVDMESASIAHVCYFNNISVVCIRVISDSGNKIEFRKFADLSAVKLKDVIVKFLDNIGGI